MFTMTPIRIRNLLLLLASFGLILLALPAPSAAQSAQITVSLADYVAAYDTTPGNRGGACRDGDVDIRLQGGACSIGWWSAGEWLDYDLAVPAASDYAVSLRAATGVSGNRVVLRAASQVLTVALPNTGSAAHSTTIAGGSLHLDAGIQRLRLTGDGHAMDIAGLSLQLGAAVAPAQPPSPTTSAALPDTPGNRGPVFQLSCMPGQRLSDDPIVFPGRPGASHEHQFFGNLAADANATYEGLQAAPTTCADAADRASYWLPALYATGTTLTTPYRLRVYYYANSADLRVVQPFPPNLRMLAGDPRATSPQPRGVVDWLCRDRRDQSAGRPLQRADPPTCKPTEFLSLSIRFPDCWDGVHLDSADHRSHMAYADDGGHCPLSHPVKLPRLRYSITYEGTAWFGGAFTLGGPAMMPMALPPSAMHADFWNIWEPAALTQYVERCLQRGQNVRGTACTR